MIDVSRASQIPASLGNGTSYDGSDVKAQLFSDFLGKCYLCEGPITLGSMEIDHRHPVNDGGGEFDWSNLFACCRSCNSRRPRRWPVAGLLDPARGGSVETRVAQAYSDGEAMVFAGISASDVAANNTAAELDRIHNGPHAKAVDLRHAIRDRLLEVFEIYRCWVRMQRGTDAAAQALAHGHLCKALSRCAPYTMLVRSVFKDELSHIFD